MKADIAGAWASQDPDRIAQTLGQLLELPPPRPPIPPPTPTILDAFPPDIPTEVVMNYIALLGTYRPMQPEPPPGEVVRYWVEAVLRSGNGSAALQVVLALREEDPFPGAEVSDALGYVAVRGVFSSRDEAGAEHLARNFLDHSQTYDRAIRALRPWKDDKALAEILGRLTPYVQSEHRASLGLSQANHEQ